MNRRAMREGVRRFLEGLLEGADEIAPLRRRELLEAGPERIAAAWADELLAGYGADPAAGLEPIAAGRAQGVVVVDGLRFDAVCEHHLLPFTGRAAIGYAPAERHAGLGGLVRALDALARRLTLQERLAAELAELLWERLAPRGLVVVLEAEHLCLAARGARRPGHRVRTCERRGELPVELERLAARGPAAIGSGG